MAFKSSDTHFELKHAGGLYFYSDKGVQMYNERIDLGPALVV